jgi:hypothetical protein
LLQAEAVVEVWLLVLLVEAVVVPAVIVQAPHKQLLLVLHTL